MARRVYEVDEAVEDAPARPPLLPRVLVAVGVVPWVLLGLATLGGGVLYLMTLAKCESAIQEASVSAMAAAVFVALYLLARSAEKVLAGVARLTGRG